MEAMELPFQTELELSESLFSVGGNCWSPAVDLGWFTSDDFNSMFEVMICDGDSPVQESTPESIDSINAGRSDASEGTTEPTANRGDCKGLRLVHLLMAAAEAIGGGDKEGEDLAWVILVRLRELASPSQGTNMERLAAYFTRGLQHVLEGSRSPSSGPNPPTSQLELLSAFQLLQQMSPCIKFGHFVANQAIIEAVRFERGVHIIDYDIMEGAQWAPLMQALVCREGGPPLRLRITALTRAHGSRRSLATAGDTGRWLAAFAASIGQPFTFHQCRLDQGEHLRPSSVKLLKGDAVVVNCMLHLPHSPNRLSGSVESVLRGALTLDTRPTLVTLVEDEGLWSYGEGLVGEFMALLHHYSAIYDSLEASYPSQGRARGLVEEAMLGPKIEGSLARLFDKGRSRRTSWSEWMMAEASGFKPQPISTFNHCQAKLLLGLFNDGYRVEQSKNKLFLGWKDKRLLEASTWSPLACSCELNQG